MNASLAFVRRASPDWRGLSRDFKAGVDIDPARYLPPQGLAGFPLDIPGIVAEWNRRLPIDWFAFRAALADISARSVRAVPSAVVLSLSEPEKVLLWAEGGDGLAYFHDDDDVFSPEIAELHSARLMDVDAVVTASYEINILEPHTLVREDQVPPVLIGPVLQQPSHARFQTNNTGIHSRWLRTNDNLLALRDHVTASSFAAERGFRDAVLPYGVSATIKTLASATWMSWIVLPEYVNSPSVLGCAEALEEVRNSVPSTWDWLRHPLQDIAVLCRALIAGRDGVSPTTAGNVLGATHAPATGGHP